MTALTMPRTPFRRIATTGSIILLMGCGILFDVACVMNVPGAAIWTDGALDKVSALGGGLALLVIVLWLTLIVRRSAPVVTVAAGAVLALIGVSYVLLLIGAGYTARRHPSRSAQIGVGVTALVLLFAAREATTAWGGALPWYFTSRVHAQYEPEWIVATFALAVVALGITAGSVHYARTRAQASANAARAEVEHRRADALTEQMVRQSERERIARDMHDALAHRLSVVSLHAGALEIAAAHTPDGGTGGDAREIARTVREQTQAALQDMRGLIGDLRSPEVATSAVPVTMRALGPLVAELRAVGAAIRTYIVIESPERASAMLDGAVFRIAQESLTNALRYSAGGEINLFLQVNPQSGTRIRIENSCDEARVAVPLPGGGNGILGIRERTTALGGEAWIGAYQGQFIVDVSLPWQERG